MEYVIKLVGTCPDGAVDYVEYWIAKDETEMKAMLALNRTNAYTGITCLGPVVEPTEFMREMIDKSPRPVGNRDCPCSSRPGGRGDKERVIW